MLLWTLLYRQAWPCCFAVRTGSDDRSSSAGQTCRLTSMALSFTRSIVQALCSPVASGIHSALGTLRTARHHPARARVGPRGGAVIPILERIPEARGRSWRSSSIRSAQDLLGASSVFARRLDAASLKAMPSPGFRAYRGPPFQMIIDDISTEQNGEPVRAVRADATWIQSLSAILDQKGILPLNAFSRGALHNARCFADARSRRFGAAYRLEDPRFENAIGVASRLGANTNAFWRRVRSTTAIRQPLAFQSRAFAQHEVQAKAEAGQRLSGIGGFVAGGRRPAVDSRGGLLPSSHRTGLVGPHPAPSGQWRQTLVCSPLPASHLKVPQVALRRSMTWRCVVRCSRNKEKRSKRSKYAFDRPSWTGLLADKFHQEHDPR